MSVTSQEIVANTTATYRQVDNWAKRGYLRVLNPGEGSGTPRLFADGELAVARAMAVLTKAGLLPQAAHLVARGKPLPGGVVVLIPPPFTTGYRGPQTRPTTGGVL